MLHDPDYFAANADQNLHPPLPPKVYFDVAQPLEHKCKIWYIISLGSFFEHTLHSRDKPRDFEVSNDTFSIRRVTSNTK